MSCRRAGKSWGRLWRGWRAGDWQHHWFERAVIDLSPEAHLTGRKALLISIALCLLPSAVPFSLPAFGRWHSSWARGSSLGWHRAQGLKVTAAETLSRLTREIQLIILFTFYSAFRTPEVYKDPNTHPHKYTNTPFPKQRHTTKASLSSLCLSLSPSRTHSRTHTHTRTRSLSPPLPPSCYLWLGETSRSTNINYKGQRKVRRRQLSKGVVMLFQVNCKCVRGKISPQWFLSAWLMGTGADSLPELLQLCLKPHTFQQEPSAWAFLNSVFISFIKGIRQVGICMKRILWEYCLQGRYFHDFPHPGALSVSLLFLSLFC